MRICFVDEAFEDLAYWSQTDKKIHARILRIIKETSRTPFSGIGKPEPLKGNYSGCWSRRIDDANRLIYAIEKNDLVILACRHHY